MTSTTLIGGAECYDREVPLVDQNDTLYKYKGQLRLTKCRTCSAFWLLPLPHISINSNTWL
jgi:hypothetical protein